MSSAMLQTYHNFLSTIISGFLRRIMEVFPDDVVGVVRPLCHLSFDSFADCGRCGCCGDTTASSASNGLLLHWDDEHIPTHWHPQFVRLSSLFSFGCVQNGDTCEMIRKFQIRLPNLDYNETMRFIAGCVPSASCDLSPMDHFRAITAPFYRPSKTIHAHCRWTTLHTCPGVIEFDAGSGNAPHDCGLWLMSWAERRAVYDPDHLSCTIAVKLIFARDQCTLQLGFGDDDPNWVHIHTFHDRNTCFSTPRCLVLSVCGITHLELLESDFRLYDDGRCKEDDTTSAESGSLRQKIKRYDLLVSITSYFVQFGIYNALNCPLWCPGRLGTNTVRKILRRPNVNVLANAKRTRRRRRRVSHPAKESKGMFLWCP